MVSNFEIKKIPLSIEKSTLISGGDSLYAGAQELSNLTNSQESIWQQWSLQSTHSRANIWNDLCLRKFEQSHEKLPIF